MLCHGPLHTCFYFALSRATSHTFLLCFVTGHFTHVFTLLCHGPLHTCFYFALSLATSHMFLLCFVTGHFTHVFTLLCHGPLHTCFYFALPHTTPNTFLPMLCHSNKCLLMLFTFHFKRVFVSFVKRHPDMF
jgi:hypothetical protein